MFVKRTDNAICVEEAGKIAMTMATITSRFKSKHEVKSTPLHGRLAKIRHNPPRQCWRYRKNGHNKKDFLDVNPKIDSKKPRPQFQTRKPKKI